jgi:hypothetical protein
MMTNFEHRNGSYVLTGNPNKLTIHRQVVSHVSATNIRRLLAIQFVAKPFDLPPTGAQDFAFGFVFKRLVI